MSYNSPVRIALSASGRKLKPSWHTYHELGVELMNTGVVSTYATFEEIGLEFGITKQMAYHEVAVALGKLTYLMREKHPQWKDHFQS